MKTMTKTYPEFLKELKDFLQLDWQEFAEHLGINYRTLEGWLYQGRIPRAAVRRKIDAIASKARTHYT